MGRFVSSPSGPIRFDGLAYTSDNEELKCSVDRFSEQIVCDEDEFDFSRSDERRRDKKKGKKKSGIHDDKFETEEMKSRGSVDFFV